MSERSTAFKHIAYSSAATYIPDGHFKFPHLWPPKFPRQDRRNYAADGAVARRAAASRSR